MSEIKALFFDVFGTVVDWRGSVARLGAAMADEIAAPADLDWTAFADAWRAEYQPAMAEVRAGRRPFARLDLLHRDAIGPNLSLIHISDPRDDELSRMPSSA